MKKIAVVNRTNLKNYGSVLQCYALCKAVENLGYQSEVVWEKGNISNHYDLRPRKIMKILWKMATSPKLLSDVLKSVKEVRSKEIDQRVVELFDLFVSKYFNQTFLQHNQLVKVSHSDEYHKFICGSDQIWTSTTLYVDPLMYLRFAPQEKRIAYAPSIGRDYIPEYNRREMRKYISQIPSVSIRETVGQKLISELTGRKVPVVLDPTLLLTQEQWSEIEVHPEDSTKYILCYFLDAPDQTMQERIVQFARNHNLRIVALGNEVRGQGEEIQPAVCGPAEFLGYVDHAEMVITDSYHGMLFAINYGKRFWSVARNYKQYDQSSRQLSVLDMLGCRDRYLNAEGEFSMEALDYEQIGSVIQQMRSQSVQFLKNALEDSI